MEVDANCEDIYDTIKRQHTTLEARGEKIHPDALPSEYRGLFWTTVLTAAPSDSAHVFSNTSIRSADSRLLSTRSRWS